MRPARSKLGSDGHTQQRRAPLQLHANLASLFCGDLFGMLRAERSKADAALMVVDAHLQVGEVRAQRVKRRVALFFRAASANNSHAA